MAGHIQLIRRNIGAIVAIAVGIITLSGADLAAAGVGATGKSHNSRTANFLEERLQRHSERSGTRRSQDFSLETSSYISTNFAKPAIQGVRVSEPSSPATFTQLYSDIARFGDGSAVVVWQDNRNGDWDIFVQRLALDGTPSSANLDLITDPNFHDQLQPQVAVNANDVALLVWNGAAGGGIHGLILDDALTVVAGPLLLSDTSPEVLVNMPALASLSNNRFVVVWEDSRSGSNIFAQIVGGDGLLHGENFKINGGGAAAWRIAPDIVSSMDGDFAVVWEEPSSGNPDVMFRLFTDVGTPIFPDFQVGSTHTTATQVMPKVAYLGNQNYLAGWISDRNGEQSIWIQQITTSSIEADTAIRLNDDADNISWDLSFAQVSSGGVVALWADYSGTNSIKLQQITSDGGLTGNNQVLEEGGLLRERCFPSGALSGDGCHTIWADQRDGDFDIYLQCLDNAYQKIGGNVRLNNDNGGAQQFQPGIALLTATSSGIVWCDERNDEGDIYFRLANQQGSMIGSSLRVNSDSERSLQNDPKIAGNRNGKGVIVWSDNRAIDGVSSQRIMAQIVTSAPGLLFNNFQISNDTSPMPKTDADVSIAPDGAFAVVWTDRRDGSQQVYLQAYNSNNSPVSPNMKISEVLSTTANFKPSVSVAADHSGVAAWLAIDGAEQTIYYQRFDSFSSLIDANQLLPVATGGLISDVSVYYHAGSGIAYFSYLRQSTDVNQIEVVAIDLTGSLLWGPLIVNEELGTSITDVRLAGGTSALGVSWTDHRTGSGRVWLQLVNLDGSFILANQPLSGLGESAREMHPAVALSESYYYSAWIDNRNSAEGYDVFFANDQFTATAVEDDAVILPDRFELEQNFPNPFNPETVISFTLEKAEQIKLTVYNTLGQRVRTLVDEWQAAGSRQVRWNGETDDGAAVASGVYLYRLETAEAVQTRKMTLVK